MRSLASFEKIFLHRDPVDFRKSLNGLGAEEMKLDPFDSALFIFCCQRRRRLKILYWDKTGFALWYKRLEAAQFPWPKKLDEIVSISAQELEWVLEGVDVWKIKRHEEKNYERMC